jgi:hypothetical protein
MVIAVNLSVQPAAGHRTVSVRGPLGDPPEHRWREIWRRSKDETTPFNFNSATFQRPHQPGPLQRAHLHPGRPRGGRETGTGGGAVEENPAVKTFSMYASINVVGTFNNGNLTNAPLKRNRA